MRRLIALALMAALLPLWALGTETAAYCADAGDIDMLAKVNAYRQGKGQAPLVLDQALGAAAEHHALDLATQGANPTHTLSDGTTWLANVFAHGYPSEGTHRGETIGWGFGGDNARMLAWWQGSATHDRVLLDRTWTAVGVKRVSVPGSRWGWYWVLDFGTAPHQSAAVCGKATAGPTSTPRTTATAVPTAAATIAPTATTVPSPSPSPTFPARLVCDATPEPPRYVLVCEGA